MIIQGRQISCHWMRLGNAQTAARRPQVDQNWLELKYDMSVLARYGVFCGAAV